MKIYAIIYLRKIYTYKMTEVEMDPDFVPKPYPPAEIDEKVRNFSELMNASKNNRRLARYALSQSHGLMGNWLITSPYTLKYSTYKDKNDNPVIIDEITERYRELLGGTQKNITAANAMTDILSPDRSGFKYFGGFAVACVIVLLLIGTVLFVMFWVKPDNNTSIIFGLSAGAFLAFPLVTVFRSLPALWAWFKTST